MAQHINTNQLHQMAQLPMLQAAGLNLTILNNQQHHLSQFAQPGHQGMYQIVQQVQPGHGQVQLQNVVHQQPHQFNNIHHMQQQQQLQQQQHILVQSQHQQQIQQHHIHQTNHQQQVSQQQQQVQQQQNDNNNSQLTKSGKKKKSKVNKDGVPAPKRATTAYINFTQWYRRDLKNKGKFVPKIGEFGKECAAKWNSMTEEEKKPFTDVAEKDRARYRREMEVYKPARDANKPKRPGTAFMLFMVDFRKELAGKEPEGGVAALAKLGGERWRGMTDEEKRPYCEKQNECKLKYEAAMEEYRKATGINQCSGNTGNLVKETKSEASDSDTSKQLNDSLSNSNISNNNGNSVDQHDRLNLKNDEHQLQNHNSQSPGSTSVSPHTHTASPSPSQQHQQQQQQSSMPSIATTISLQSQSFYTPSNSFVSNNFLGQQHEDGSYNQTLDQQLEQHQLHESQQQQQQDQQQDTSYLQNGAPPAYQTQSHYQWN